MSITDVEQQQLLIGGDWADAGVCRLAYVTVSRPVQVRES